MKKRINKTISIAVVLGFALLGVIFWRINLPVEVNDEEEVNQVVTVIKDDLRITVDGDGRAVLDAKELAFSQNGTLAQIFVSEGEWVEKGDFIAELDKTSYENSLDNAEKAFLEAQIDLKTAEKDHEFSLQESYNSLKTKETSYQRLSDEYEKMLLIPEAYSQAVLTEWADDIAEAERSYQLAKEKYEYALQDLSTVEIKKLNVEKKNLAVKDAQEELEEAIMIAETEGQVVSIEKQTGEYIKDNEVVIQLAIPEDMQIEVEISEYEISQLEIGQAVEVAFDTFWDQKFKGTIETIDILSTIDNNDIVNYLVKVKLDEINKEIKDGMTAEVSFILAGRDNVLVIPNKAVTMVEGQQIVIVEENGTEAERVITTGLTDGSMVEIMSGLEVGEKVIIKK